MYFSTRGRYWLNSEGKTHRDDGPAFEYFDWDRYWYINNKLHREDGPAVGNSSGIIQWFKDGKLHREDGPAVENLGTRAWYKNGLRHREDGPAIVWHDGSHEYYLNGTFYTKKTYLKEIERRERNDFKS